MKKKFEIPYNFSKHCLKKIVDNHFTEDDWIEFVYIPAYYKHCHTTRLEYGRFPSNIDDYIGHIRFIQSLRLDIAVLLQSEEELEDSVISFYLNLGVRNFIVKNDNTARRIKQLNPNAKTIASITKLLTLNDILAKDLSMYDKIVLDFRMNDIDIVRKLPKSLHYILMPNSKCCKDTPKERCMTHWGYTNFNFLENEFKCNETSMGVNSAYLTPDQLKYFDEYVDGYKLQGREIPYDYMYNIIFPYVEDYYNDRKL